MSLCYSEGPEETEELSQMSEGNSQSQTSLCFSGSTFRFLTFSKNKTSRLFFKQLALFVFMPVAVPGPILLGHPVCLERVASVQRSWHCRRRSMSDAGVTCRPNTTTPIEEGRMIARSYRALFWTHTQAWTDVHMETEGQTN